MNQIEFGKKCRELNKQYKELFGEIPSPSDYNQPYEKYIVAMEKAIADNVKLEKVLAKNQPIPGSKSN